MNPTRFRSSKSYVQLPSNPDDGWSKKWTGYINAILSTRGNPIWDIGKQEDEFCIVSAGEFNLSCSIHSLFLMKEERGIGSFSSHQPESSSLEKNHVTRDKDLLSPGQTLKSHEFRGTVHAILPGWVIVRIAWPRRTEQLGHLPRLAPYRYRGES